MCNPLGTARGDHKECGVQAATLNLPASKRFETDSIFLVALAKAKVYKVHGMARVINGQDQHGDLHQEPNVGADFRELDQGRWIEIPDDRPDPTSSTRWIRLRGWTLVFSADYLGAQSMLPTIESPNAHVFCRGCDYDVRSNRAARPFSFLKAPEPGATQAAFKEREWQTEKATLEKLRAGVSATVLKNTLHDKGWNKLFFALDPDYIPHIDPTTIAPQDLLHAFPDGLLRSELAWLMFTFGKLGLDFSLVDTATKRCTSLPKDVRIPPFPPRLKEGTGRGADTRPRSEAVARMTGSQCMHFTLSSPEILDPLLSDEMRSHPAWLSWLKLVELFATCVQHSFHTSDIQRIDELVLEHSRLFDAVPSYNGLKRPKHHFMSHLALDLWRFGPLRGYWCFGFEAFNRVIKHGAQKSNWKNTTCSIMMYWSARSARVLANCIRI